MKKAEEYDTTIKELIQNEVCMGTFGLVELELRKILKQVQIEAIDYTVKRCAEEASLIVIDEEGKYPEKEISYHEDSTGGSTVINKQSILNVADKIKDEL